MPACENCNVGEVRKSMAAWARARDRAGLEGGFMAETEGQEIMQVMGSFKGREDQPGQIVLGGQVGLESLEGSENSALEG